MAHRRCGVLVVDSSQERRMASRKERIEVAALVAEIIGAVAVVISVAYLAVQVSEGN